MTVCPRGGDVDTCDDDGLATQQMRESHIKLDVELVLEPINERPARTKPPAAMTQK